MRRIGNCRPSQLAPVADDAHALARSAPTRRTRVPRRRPSSREMRAEHLPEPAVRPFAEEVQVHLAERRHEPVRIAALPRRAVLGDEPEVVAERQRRAREERGEQPVALRSAARSRRRAPPPRSRRRAGWSTRTTTPATPPRPCASVRAQHLVRIARAALRAARRRAPASSAGSGSALRRSPSAVSPRSSCARLGSLIASLMVCAARFDRERLVTRRRALVAMRRSRARSAAASSVCGSTRHPALAHHRQLVLRRVHHHHPDLHLAQRGQRESHRRRRRRSAAAAACRRDTTRPRSSISSVAMPSISMPSTAPSGSLPVRVRQLACRPAAAR